MACVYWIHLLSCLVMISVMIVDDHAPVRETWSFILQTYSGIGKVYECSSGIEAIEAAGTLQPDVILMDINMEPISGIDATKEILRLYPNMKIIGVSTHTERFYVRSMFAAGALGYVTKNSPVNEMITAIQTVIKGDSFLCTELGELHILEELPE